MRLAVGLSHRLSSIKVHEAGVMRRLESGVKGHVLTRGSPGAARWPLGRRPAPPPAVSVVPESSFIKVGSRPSQGAPVRR